MKAIELEPNVGEHYAQIGALYELANLHTRADRYFDEALRRDPDNETVRSARAKRGGAGTKPEKGDKPATKVADKAKGLFGRDRS